MTALELIHAARYVFHREQLASIACMRVIGSQLDEFDGQVCRVMCSRLVSLAIQWDDHSDSFAQPQVPYLVLLIRKYFMMDIRGAYRIALCTVLMVHLCPQGSSLDSPDLDPPNPNPVDLT